MNTNIFSNSNLSGFSSLLSGFIFGLGLIISGMANPQVVKDFLTISANWNPALLFVLGTAVPISVLGYMILPKLKKPLFAKKFSIPNNQLIDRNLVVGAILFGLGWGISGVCPGPAIVGIAISPNFQTLTVLFGIVVGVYINHFQTKAK